MQIIPLSEGAFTVDKTKQFIPFNLGTEQLSERTRGSLLVEIQPFVVITETDKIVIDTGLGFTDQSGQLQIHNNLRKNNIEPEQVTKVLLSHLHKDHAGGISHEGKISFPNATYYINKQEFEYALNNNGSSYVTEDFMVLRESPQLQLLNDTGQIDNYIKYEMCNAHSPFHQVFWIAEKGQTTFFGGDVAPQLQQMKSRFIAKYDHDGRKSMELRRSWWDKGSKENWTFLFYHDIKNPIYSGNGS
jgi:glyoxylase-like metal-dependent hydrolase (beta-lactamase superfamily II)